MQESVKYLKLTEELQILRRANMQLAQENRILKTKLAEIEGEYNSQCNILTGVRADWLLKNT
jgi:transposase-like protein